MKLRRPDRITVFSGISALLLSAAFAIGPLFTGNSSKLVCVLSFLMYLPIFWFAIYKLYGFFDKLTKRRVRKVDLAKTRFSFKNFWLFFAIVIIPSILLLLAFWPGHFGYDVGGELLGEGVYSDHHPLIHVLWLHGIVKIGNLLNFSPNWTVALMSISQIVLCAVIYAYISEFFSRITSRKCGIFVALLFALLPASSFAMIAVTKDTVHVAMFCLVVTLAYRLFCLKSPAKRDIVAFVAIAGLFGITRNNSIYILALFGIFSFFLLKRHALRKTMTICAFSSLVVAVILNAGLAAYAHPYKLQASAAFSLPLQLVAGTVDAHPELIPEINSGEKILGFFEYSSDFNTYDFFNKGSDVTKNNSYAKQIEGRELEFLVLTARTGLRHPADYLRVFGDQTLSSWYPFSYDYAYYYYKFGGQLNFNESTTQQTAMLSNVQDSSKIPFLRDFLSYEFRELHYRDNPILLFLCAPASYVLALLVLALYLAYRKDKILFLATSFALSCYFVILIAAPCILVRYMLPIMLAVPLLYMLTLRSRARLY